MRSVSQSWSIHIFVIVIASLAFAGCAAAQSESSGDQQDYRAACSTEPGGNNVTILAGVDNLSINLLYSVPCELGPMCTGATFTSTMNSNQFFGDRHVLDEWGVGAGLGNTRRLTLDTSGWEGIDRIVVQVRSSQTGDTVLASCDFTLTAVDPRPASPQLTSLSHSLGQPSCEPLLTVSWSTPSAAQGVAGYSYAIVNQDDPLYDVRRWPEENADLDASIQSFTTGSLEPGHVWEFNLRTIDNGGLASEFYSSFWTMIESCAVNVISPKSGDSFEVGKWVGIFWKPVSYDGVDVSAGYNVSTIELLQGSSIVHGLVVNQANTLNSGFLVPELSPGTDYRVRITLSLNSAGDSIPELPETLIGISETFSITTSNS